MTLLLFMASILLIRPREFSGLTGWVIFSVSLMSSSYLMMRASIFSLSSALVSSVISRHIAEL